MAERLTNRDENGTFLVVNGCCIEKEYFTDMKETMNAYYAKQLIDKLCKLEDILEKYGIESVEELEEKLNEPERIWNANLKDLKQQVKREINKELETDRDAWKRACELACDYMCKFVIPCPDIHRKECESFCDLNKADCYKDYFYQQAKKEGE